MADIRPSRVEPTPTYGTLKLRKSVEPVRLPRTSVAAPGRPAAPESEAALSWVSTGRHLAPRDLTSHGHYLCASTSPAPPYPTKGVSVRYGLSANPGVLSCQRSRSEVFCLLRNQTSCWETGTVVLSALCRWVRKLWKKKLSQHNITKWVPQGTVP